MAAAPRDNAAPILRVLLEFGSLKGIDLIAYEAGDDHDFLFILGAPYFFASTAITTNESGSIFLVSRVAPVTLAATVKS